MRLILDTVTFIWAASAPERLSRAAMSALRKGTAVREIGVVSLTGIAVKQTRGKLTFSNADAMAGITDLRLRILAEAARRYGPARSAVHRFPRLHRKLHPLNSVHRLPPPPPLALIQRVAKPPPRREPSALGTRRRDVATAGSTEGGSMTDSEVTAKIWKHQLLLTVPLYCSSHETPRAL